MFNIPNKIRVIQRITTHYKKLFQYFSIKDAINYNDTIADLTTKLMGTKFIFAEACRTL